MNRCYLKAVAGDSINAILAVAGSNLQKLLRAMTHALIFWLLSRLETRISSDIERRPIIPATL